MKGFSQLNKAFDSRVRLGLMSILTVNNWVSYREIKNLLGITMEITLAIYGVRENFFYWN